MSCTTSQLTTLALVSTRHFKYDWSGNDWGEGQWMYKDRIIELRDTIVQTLGAYVRVEVVAYVPLNYGAVYTLDANYVPHYEFSGPDKDRAIASARGSILFQ